MADDTVEQPATATEAPTPAPVDEKAARRAARAAKREAARLEREGPPRTAFVVTKAFTADGVEISAGVPVLLTEAGAQAWADNVRAATKFDLSAGRAPRPIG